MNIEHQYKHNQNDNNMLSNHHRKRLLLNLDFWNLANKLKANLLILMKPTILLRDQYLNYI